jgi:hypothetical protein
VRKIILFAFFILSGFILKAQDETKKISTQFIGGLAKLNHLGINNALQTGFSLEIQTKKWLLYNIGYQYILGASIKADDLNFLSKTFNYNSHVQQSQFNGLVGVNILNYKKIGINVHTGLSLNFLKQSFVNNIYLKEIVPSWPLQLVSESTFEKKFQVGITSEISTIINLGKFSPGINLQYQFQKEFQFFSPSIFLNYKL